MKNIILIISVLLTLPISVIGGYGEKPPGELDTMTFEGKVTNIDSVAKKISIRCFNENLSFDVPEKIRITRANEEITLDDIDVGDIVTVEYRRIAPGIIEAVAIVDNNIGYD